MTVLEFWQTYNGIGEVTNGDRVFNNGGRGFDYGVGRGGDGLWRIKNRHLEGQVTPKRCQIGTKCQPVFRNRAWR
jgi:hypothetical protein